MAKKIVPSKEMIHILNSIWSEIGFDVMMCFAEEGKTSISRATVVEIVLDCDRPVEMINRDYADDGEQKAHLLAEIELWRAQGYPKMKKIATLAFESCRYCV
jgi:hypothetical protein